MRQRSALGSLGNRDRWAGKVGMRQQLFRQFCKWASRGYGPPCNSDKVGMFAGQWVVAGAVHA